MRLLALLLLILSAASFGQDAIRTGDTIRIECDREPGISGIYRVDMEGRTRLPMLGSIALAGLSTASAADKISTLLSRMGLGARATVLVAILPSAMSSVRFAGAVERPGEIPFRNGMKVRDVVEQAKPTEEADLGRVMLIRPDGAEIALDLKTAEGLDRPLAAGDQLVFTPASGPREVFVLGAVARPGSLPYVAGMTVRRAIEAAGGLTPRANRRKIKIVKDSGEEWPFDYADQAMDFQLAAGDAVGIPAIEGARFVSVVGAVRLPGAVELSATLTVRQAIAAAGGSLPEADIGKTVLRRPVSKANAFGQLMPYDIIEVPYKSAARSAASAFAVRILQLVLVFGR